MSLLYVGMVGFFVAFLGFFHLSVPAQLRQSPLHTFASIMGNSRGAALPFAHSGSAYSFLLVSLAIVGAVLYAMQQYENDVVAYEAAKAEQQAKTQRVLNEARNAPSAMTPDLSVPIKRQESFEQSVERAWQEAAAANREAENAMEKMIEGYRNRAVSAETSSTGGVRIDTFVMKSGDIVVCRTTMRSNARATTCN